MIWFPHLTLTTSKILYKLLFFLYHYVPAFLADIVLYFKGSTLSAMKIYSKIYYHLGLYEYFMKNHWEFSDENMKKVHSKMSQTDHDIFPCEVRRSPEEAEKYALDSYLGLKKFILKDTDEDLDQARRKYMIIKIAYHLLWATIYGSLTYCLLSKVNFDFYEIHQNISKWNKM